MNRRGFLSASGAAALVAGLYRESWAQPFEPPLGHRLPASDADYQRAKFYIEEVSIQQYHWASDRAVEAFQRPQVRAADPLGHLFGIRKTRRIVAFSFPAI